MLETTSLLTVLLAALSCGCGASGSPPAEPSGAPPETTARRSQPVRDPAEATPAPPSGVHVFGLDGSRLAIRVVNGGTAVARLRRALRLERFDGNAWQAADVGAIWLRDDCNPRDGVVYWAHGGSECVDVAAGATFVAPAWMGTVGDAQCICEECVPAPAGRYRLDATTCDGATLEGEPFDFPGSH